MNFSIKTVLDKSHKFWIILLSSFNSKYFIFHVFAYIPYKLFKNILCFYSVVVFLESNFILLLSEYTYMHMLHTYISS